MADRASTDGSRDNEMIKVDVGDRVRIDSAAVRMSFPKDRTGQVSPHGVRLGRIFERIVDETGFMPYVTEVRAADIEIASSYFEGDMTTLRIPCTAVLTVVVRAEGLRRCCTEEGQESQG